MLHTTSSTSFLLLYPSVRDSDRNVRDALNHDDLTTGKVFGPCTSMGSESNQISIQLVL